MSVTYHCITLSQYLITTGNRGVSSICGSFVAKDIDKKHSSLQAGD